MDGFGTIVQLLFEALGIEPQPWMGVVLLLLAAVLLGPAAFKNIRTQQARKRVVRLHDMEAEERSAAIEEIIGLVERNPQGLVSIADEALRRRQRGLAVAAYEQLRRLQALPRDVLRLHEELYGRRPEHPEQEAAAIERLLDAGARERAAERLARARAWFPDDPGLAALATRMEEPASAASPPPDDAERSVRQA